MNLEADREFVKSQAIVKFESVDVPASFNRLKCNTNLNIAPSNWLSNAANSYGFSKKTHTTGFSSFRIAHMFPDLCGKVDVISDSENIKNLLKTPYTDKGILSYFVHRIGNTLLIDEFDLHKYLLRSQDEDWQWLRSFIYENILNSLNEKERKMFIKLKTKEVLMQKNLMSKFLYYSIEDTNNSLERSEHNTKDTSECNQRLQLSIPRLPEPKKEVPDPQNDHVYNRNVLWTFEDISMLVGSDMQIFGNCKRPCVSLRLRDMKKPINILTGIDYYLDNLMCNVPEIIMCYHLDGIVQKYELIKTEDLPYLEDSKFSPKIVRNVAQNILSFLKSNATKAGRTYWLFKGKNDDVVKLYDLTTLCEENNKSAAETEAEKSESRAQNPFTIPVAMLLYTVARNMRYSSEKLSTKKAGSIKMLLENCLKLLPKEKYPQIVTSSHYMLSDLHIPASTDPVSPTFSDEDSDDTSVFDDDDIETPVESDGEDGEIVSNLSPAIQSIQDTLKEYNGNEKWKYKKTAPPLTGTVEERCETSLKHIIEGLSCLKFFENENEDKKKEQTQSEKDKILHEELNPNMAKPFNPIPLPYESLSKEAKLADPTEVIPMPWEEKKEKKEVKKSKKKTKKQTITESSTECENPVNEFNKLDSKSLLLKNESNEVIKNWHIHLKILLFEKACLVYATLAESSYSNENYGISLKNLLMSIRCQELVTKYVNLITSQSGCILGRAGDCYFSLCKNLDNIEMNQKEFDNFNELDQQILEEIEKDLTDGDFKIREIGMPSDKMENLFESSCDCYEAALRVCSADSKTELKRRLGNVYNELGVFLMHSAQKKYNIYVENLNQSRNSEDSTKSDESEMSAEANYQQTAKKSYDTILKAIHLFEDVSDTVNLVICYLNLGRFYRFSAHANIYGNEPISFQNQKKFYNEAFSCYQRALGLLENRKTNPDLWDLVSWELSTATFTFSKQMQDNNDGENIEELEEEVVDMLKRSLKLCESESSKLSAHYQILYLFRAALIHHRLASFYHNLLRNGISDDTKKRITLQLCRLNYEKAAKQLENLKECQEFLQVQLERIALQEHQVDVTLNNQHKIQNYQRILPLFYQTMPILLHLHELTSYEQLNVLEIEKLLDLLEKRLQEVLKNLMKLMLTKSHAKKEKQREKLITAYKKMYGFTLRKPEKLPLREFSKHLYDVLEKICDSENESK